MTVTVSHRDTCLACFVTDHHNRPGECLVGVFVDAASRVHHVKTALYDEAAGRLGHRDDAPDMAALSAAINEAFKGAHPLKSFDKTLEPAVEGDEPGESCQAWFLIKWPAVEAEGYAATAAMVPQLAQQQQARADDDAGAWRLIHNRGLSAPMINDLTCNIGRYCRFTNWQPSHGLITRGVDMLITGTQLDCAGNLCYRVRATGADTFGRCVSPGEVDICDSTPAMVPQPAQQQQARDVRRGMARCDEAGCWQIGIYCVARDDAGKWAAAATGPGTIGDGYVGTYDTLAAAYLALTGEPMPGAATAAMVPQPVQQQQARAAAPSHSADAYRPRRIAFGPARLYPAAEGAILTGTPDTPDGADLIGYNSPAGRFYAAAYRLANGCVLVDVCSPRGPYDARLRRVFVNLECAELYAGRLARLGAYRARRFGDMVALGHMRAAAVGAPATSWARSRVKTTQRQLAAWRQSNRDVLEAFGAELPPVIDDAPAFEAMPTDLQALADWLA